MRTFTCWWKVLVGGSINGRLIQSIWKNIRSRVWSRGGMLQRKRFLTLPSENAAAPSDIGRRTPDYPRIFCSWVCSDFNPVWSPVVGLLWCDIISREGPSTLKVPIFFSSWARQHFCVCWSLHTKSQMSIWFIWSNIRDTVKICRTSFGHFWKWNSDNDGMQDHAAGLKLTFKGISH